MSSIGATDKTITTILQLRTIQFMGNTYTQLYFHIVFGVKGRQNLIAKNWEQRLYKYMTGIISNKNQKLMAINGMPDHIHILLGSKPNDNLSDIVET